MAVFLMMLGLCVGLVSFAVAVAGPSKLFERVIAVPFSAAGFGLVAVAGAFL